MVRGSRVRRPFVLGSVPFRYCGSLLVVGTAVREGARTPPWAGALTSIVCARAGAPSSVTFPVATICAGEPACATCWRNRLASRLVGMYTAGMGCAVVDDGEYTGGMCCALSGDGIYVAGM